jgi:hypothetical protein
VFPIGDGFMRQKMTTQINDMLFQYVHVQVLVSITAV